MLLSKWLQRSYPHHILSRLVRLGTGKQRKKKHKAQKLSSHQHLLRITPNRLRCHATATSYPEPASTVLVSATFNTEARAIQSKGHSFCIKRKPQIPVWRRSACRLFSCFPYTYPLVILSKGKNMRTCKFTSSHPASYSPFFLHHFKQVSLRENHYFLIFID